MNRTRPLISLLAASICLVACHRAHAAPTALSPSGEIRSDALMIVYDPNSGHVTASSPDGSTFTALELRSSTQLFTAECENLGGMFDVCNTGKVFKLTTAGFESVDFGAILPVGLSGPELLSDLKADGASFGGGFKTGAGLYFFHPDFVPEPGSCGTLVLGLTLLGVAQRRRSRR